MWYLFRHILETDYSLALKCFIFDVYYEEFWVIQGERVMADMIGLWSTSQYVNPCNIWCWYYDVKVNIKSVILYTSGHPLQDPLGCYVSCICQCNRNVLFSKFSLYISHTAPVGMTTNSDPWSVLFYSQHIMSLCRHDWL